MGFSSRGLSEAQIQAQADLSIAKVLTNTTNLVTDARGLALDHLDADISSIPIALNYPIFEFLATTSGDNFGVVAGSWDRTLSGSYETGAHLHNTIPAVDDEVGLGTIFAPSATAYTAYFYCQTGTANGIMHIFIDGVDIAQLDCYSAAGSVNEVLSVSLGTITAGIHSLVIKMASKHASATDYATRIQGMNIAKT